MFEHNFPFNQMSIVDLDGIKYRFIPNIWVRNEKLSAGATYEDCFAYMISDKPKTNYHIHPTFVTNNKINDSGVLIGEDIIAGSYAYNSIKSKAEEFNAEPFNIYDMHLLARLMMIEYGTSDIQKALTGIDGKMSVTYHGIKNVWGAENFGQWLYGLTTEEGTIHVLSSKMDGTMVDTKIVPAGSGYPANLLTAKTLNYDLGDLFIAGSQSVNQLDGILSDYQCLETESAFNSGFINNNALCGPFYLCNDRMDKKIKNIGLRLRKAC